MYSGILRSSADLMNDNAPLVIKKESDGMNLLKVKTANRAPWNGVTLVVVSR